jgi:hypothetical protein
LPPPYTALLCISIVVHDPTFNHGDQKTNKQKTEKILELPGSVVIQSLTISLPSLSMREKSLTWKDSENA